MDRIHQHPEIINPYNLDKDRAGDTTFVVDLGLDTLLNSVPFHCSESRDPAKRVLAEMGSDMNTVAYRQDVLQDLVSDRNLRGIIQDYVKSLNGLEYKLEYFRGRPNWQNGLDLIKQYRDFIDNRSDLGNANSKALKEVDSYFDMLRGSASFTELCDFLERIDNLKGIDFRVYLDKNGLPVRMSALELAEGKPEERPRKPLIERWLGKRDDGQSLRGAGEPNKLGKIIQEYMDKQFTTIVMAYLGQIREVTELLEPLDFYASFAEYFTRLREVGFDICKPTLLPLAERRMTVTNARNPLLVEARILSARNGRFHLLPKTGRGDKKVIPNDINHNLDGNMFIITGPNNGGKTTYVKTVGLVQLMAQKGLFVPAKSAEMSFVDGIYTHFVTPEDITKGEGRYRNELRRIKDVIESATPYSLVILDEPCGGTSHEEGERQSLALLDGFHKLSSTTYFTTHMHLLTKEVDSGRYPAARNLSVECLYDGKEIKYTYKVKAGAFGKSFGEEIARELGLMPENIIDTISKRAEEKGFRSILRT